MIRLFVYSGLLFLLACSQSSDSSQQVELNGTSWKLDRIVYPNGEQVNIRNPQEYQISFNEQVNIIADCNECSGNYAVNSNRISLDLSCTEKACAAPSNSDLYMLILENSYSFQQNKESLIIYSRNDEQLVFFIDQ